ncbi:hypothetical protein J1N35_029002 [Gossypium stocksii]|uniref:K Homology domain-containing protein n=1 Tax=Gossypium stocksii TaxID=47602 RepID=A0A9D3ZT44_9ROSI|nr:hypothetical protein J1N35_029002 [Gossypium stocksii]
MVEEEVFVSSTHLVPSDHKQKLEDVVLQAFSIDMPLNSTVDSVASPFFDIFRALVSENGFKVELSDEPVKEQEEALLQNEVTKQAEDGTTQTEEAQAIVKPKQVEGTTEETEQQSTDNHVTTDVELGKDEKFEADGDGSQELPTNEESKQPFDEVPQQEVDDGSTITRRIEVPNAKVPASTGTEVGLIIGKGGETIRGVQTKLGAHIQEQKDQLFFVYMGAATLGLRDQHLIFVFSVIEFLINASSLTCYGRLSFALSASKEKA